MACSAASPLTSSLFLGRKTNSTSISSPFIVFPPLSISRRPLLRHGQALVLKAKADDKLSAGTRNVKQESSSLKKVQEEEEVEVEEDLPFLHDKALDLVEFTGTVIQAVPGPRVGKSSMPWMLAVPLAYVGITFLIALVKTVRKFGSPKEKRRKLVNKNAMLCKSLDELLSKDRSQVETSSLIALMQKTEFSMGEILRKYIRYALNEKQFNPDIVADLIQLRKASNLQDDEVTEILNEISRRIVNEKGPVVMNASGYSEKGFRRKLAVQALFGKVFYLSELPGFCAKDTSLTIKEIFGVTDEDAEKLRIHTSSASQAGDVESLEQLIQDSDKEEDPTGES